MPLEQKEKEIRCINFKNKAHDVAKLIEKSKKPKKA
jgi:hypothetical protein